MSFYTDVLDFQHKFFPEHVRPSPGWPADDVLQSSLVHVREECDELLEAADSGDLAGLLDAAVDLVYVVLGLAARCGLDFDAAWDLVHRANMLKVRGVGKRGRIDVVKPPGWQPPDLRHLIRDKIVTERCCKDGY